MNTAVRGEREPPRAAVARPRPPTVRRRRAGPGTVIALHVGGAFIQGCVLGPDGSPRASERWFTRPERGPDAVVDSVLACAASLAQGCRPAAAGVALPGVVDDASGRAVRATALGWHGIPVQDWVAEHLDLPVAVGHDGRTGGLAEARAGAGVDCRNFLYLSVGDGIAAAPVVDGRAVPDGHGRTEGLGHVVVRPEDGDPCHCGRHGCLETVASTTAVTRRYARMTGWRGVTAREVYHRADAGDPHARVVCTDAVDALARVLASEVRRHAPERVVIAGEPAGAGSSRLASLRDTLAGRLVSPAVPELRLARFGDMAGCVGAAFLARDMALKGGKPTAG
ncbi:ROK family protein [Streptomyces sp. NPDC057193]|uniref:ROK family protein n=1 Tax=unclassified Streptomyces TaxID=2593676 RepID=UPI0009A0A615|nr:ROK family protein [Streptomyces sp. CB02261]